MKSALTAYYSTEFCKFNLNSSAEFNVILVSFTLSFDILVVRHQGNVLSEACPISWRSRLQTGGQCASSPPRPEAMVLMLKSFPHYPQSSHSMPYLTHWLRGLGTGLASEQYLFCVYSQETIKQVFIDLDNNEGVHGKTVLCLKQAIIRIGNTKKLKTNVRFTIHFNL